jgi:sugar lactone lactonase YvrE
MNPPVAEPDPCAVRCVLPVQDVLGESPLWCRSTDSLLWLDIDAGRVQRYHCGTGRHDVFTFDARYAGSLALTRTPGRVLVGLDLALYLFDFGTGERRLLCQVEPPTVDNRLNDGRCDALGRFWVGTMDNQLSRPSGSFYRIDPDGSAHPQFGDVIVANTVAFSPGQDTLYFSDTRRFVTWQFPLEAATGTLGPRRVFCRPFGRALPARRRCVDAEGFVWKCDLRRRPCLPLLAAGELDRIIELPVTNPTCVCLGGPDLKTMYITTARKFLDRAQLRQQPLAGSVLAIDVDVPACPSTVRPARRLARSAGS